MNLYFMRLNFVPSAFCVCKKQIAVNFSCVVLLLTINFVITLSKQSADPLGYRLATLTMLWQNS